MNETSPGLVDQLSYEPSNLLFINAALREVITSIGHRKHYLYQYSRLLTKSMAMSKENELFQPFE